MVLAVSSVFLVLQYFFPCLLFQALKNDIPKILCALEICLVQPLSKHTMNNQPPETVMPNKQQHIMMIQ